MRNTILVLHPVEDSVNMHEHSKGNTQRKMLSEATRDTHYRNLRSWSKSTPQLKLKQMEDHRRLQAQWYDIPHDKHSWEAKHFLAGYYAGHPGDWRLRLQIHFGLHPSFYWANFYSTKTTTKKESLDLKRMLSFLVLEHMSKVSHYELASCCQSKTFQQNPFDKWVQVM